MTKTTTFNKYQIYEILKNYHWMVNEVFRANEEMIEIDLPLTSKYGVESTLPKALGTVVSAVESETIRRSRKSERVYGYCEAVNFIGDNFYKITGDREKAVLDCLLDGMSIVEIAKHLCINRTTVHVIRDNIVEALAE